MKFILNILLLFFINYYCANKINDKISIGKVWPQPKYLRGCKFNNFIDPNNFTFEVVGKTCDILEDAIIRYTNIIKSSINSLIYDIPIYSHKSKNITKISVNLTGECQTYPQLNMDEWYSLEGTGQLYANSIWGILRALETFSQLLTPTDSGKLQIKDVRINDSPRFSHRGLMIDTANHYINVNTILTILDGMTYNKLNVLHWHIVNDESFPYQSLKFPELSEQGAFMQTMIYTTENVTKIIEYARMRGIRVIPEFNIPAHMASWGISHPEIIKSCGINPLSETGFIFLVVFFTEIIEIFKDNFIHIGGNDINTECWNISQYNDVDVSYKNNNIFIKFMERIIDSLSQNSIKTIVWENGKTNFQNNYYKNDVLLQVVIGELQNSLAKLTEHNFRVISSGCWDFEDVGNNIWKSYMCDPHNFKGSEKQYKLVIGGEACVWSKFIGDYNIVQNIFPRISLAAERLWSPKTVTNITDAKQRLEEHLCRMIFRGISAQPLLGPGFCG